jgi:hypothetical protein
MERSLKIVPRDLGVRGTTKDPMHFRQEVPEFILIKGVQPLKWVSNWNFCTSLSVCRDGRNEINHAPGVGCCLHHSGSVFTQKEREGLIVARDGDGVVPRLIEHVTGAAI